MTRVLGDGLGLKLACLLVTLAAMPELHCRWWPSSCLSRCLVRGSCNLRCVDAGCRRSLWLALLGLNIGSGSKPQVRGKPIFV